MIKGMVRLMRPQQWLKNLLLFFPPFLGGTIADLPIALTTVLPFLAFCAASSFTYIVNDLIDLERDKWHPKKKNRPLAKGIISRKLALFFAAVLFAFALILGRVTGGDFQTVLWAYLVCALAYSLFGKNIPVAELFILALFFNIRLEAGGRAFDIPISQWLFLSVFLLALFFAAGKRYSEAKRLGERSHDHRTVLASYPTGFLEGVLLVSAAAVLVTYSMYVVNHRTILYSIPLCAYGLIRYYFIVKSGREGDPTSSLLFDLQLFFVSLTWVLIVGFGIYGVK